jgi:hypothetical protein
MRALVVRLACLACAACVPADNALELGSLEFTIKGSHLTTEGIPPNILVDGWGIRVERALLSFQTATIGEQGAPDRCSYRGSAEQKNVVFDVRYGSVQIFDGLFPTTCPDVGFVLSAPAGDWVPGAGATGADLVMLAAGDPAHAYLEMTATRSPQTYRLVLRLDTAGTPSRFGGCRSGGVKGVRVVANQRSPSTIAFSVDAFFRESISDSAALRFAPFADADTAGNKDHVITMDELDALPLASAARYSPDAYTFPSGARVGRFGDFVRLQLKFAFFFDEDGSCVGDDPGTPAPPP